MKLAGLGRLLLLGAGLLAAYQIAIGIDALTVFSIAAYTIGFGALLLAALLLIILGLDGLDSPIVASISTIIPLSLAVGLVAEYFPGAGSPVLILASLGFLGVVVTRVLRGAERLALAFLTIVHACAGLAIFGLPIYLAASGAARPGFWLVAAGGALIGVEGILLALLRSGRPLVSRQLLYRAFPGLLLLTTLAFVVGFALV